MEQQKKFKFKQRLMLRLVPKLVHCIITFIGMTCKVELLGQENLNELEREGKNWIFSFWHNNIIGAAWVLQQYRVNVLISNSYDGELITRSVEKFNYHAVRGSSTRGGVKALLQLIKLVKSGDLGAVTPDGPRGPKYKLQTGAIMLAQKTGAPLIPFHYEATKQFVAERSWDNHKVPKPFAKIIARCGEPVYVPKKMTEEEFTQVAAEFEQKMMENTRIVEELVEKTRNI